MTKLKSSLSRRLLIFVCTLGLGFLAGWLLKAKYPENSQDLAEHLTSLRLKGYEFISPLLFCDTDNQKRSPELQPLEAKLTKLLETEKQKQNISTASVYFRDIKTGNQLNINPGEEYFPASLNKIPVMIAYYKIAESDPDILDRQFKVPDGPDMNDDQEIKPKDVAKPGETYTVQELIDKMIKYSDNNAYYVLALNLDIKVLRSTFNDLKVYFPEQPGMTSDYITANDFSYFLRVLYNATYIKKDLSEKALEVLNGVDFKDGIAAGIPAQTTLAHKFGLESYKDGDVVTSRQLHDCGIVYDNHNPYLLCVMTKSAASLSRIESSIKSISESVYQAAQTGYK